MNGQGNNSLKKEMYEGAMIHALGCAMITPNESYFPCVDTCMCMHI